jgi:outer membrane protein assembly factor BamB
MRPRLALTLIFLAGCAGGSTSQSPAFPRAPGHWPQFRGPNGDGISPEKGLLKEWPPGGPPLLWKATGFGEGVSPVSVAGGLIYVLGARDGREILTALDGDGKPVWTQEISTTVREFPIMRFLGQRAPTVDDDRLYATTTAGLLLCLKSADGTILWRKDFAELGGRAGSWQFAERPLIDGELLICAPGGSRGTLAALNKRTGEVVWRSSELKEPISYAPVTVVEIAGVRQYIVYTLGCVAGVAAKDGALLWRAERPEGKIVVVPTPILKDDLLFVSSGHGVGSTAFRVTFADGRFDAKRIYEGRQLENYFGGMILQGDHLYGCGNRGSLMCLELRTGKVVWDARGVGRGMIVCADGHLVIRGDTGPVALVEATPDGYREKGRIELASRPRDLSFSHPVLAGGRLYLRDIDTLLCYDLRGRDYQEPRPVWDIAGRVPAKPPAPVPAPAPSGRLPDAVFVPTPQDIVERMLDLAGVTFKDVLYDLGSGDGRIVMTAFRRHGCKAVGFEIDPKLVEHSRNEIRRGELGQWVKIEEKDLFTADLSEATVVTLYLGAPNNARLLPQLMKLKPGARIVSHAHLLGDAGPKPDREMKVVSKEDQIERTLYLWTAPLSKGEK